MFDVDTIKELDEATLKLVHPETGALLGAEIQLAGANHPKRKACEFNRDRILRAKVVKKGKLELTDPEDDEAYKIDRLVACTLGWKGIARNGAPIDCTPAEARAIYESSSWICDQAEAFLKDSANFLQSTSAA